MARIAGVDIPRDKRVVISLTYVYGIGKSTAKEILKATGISEDIRVKEVCVTVKDFLFVVKKLKLMLELVRVKLDQSQERKNNRRLKGNG